jgi:hypothetical protein
MALTPAGKQLLWTQHLFQELIQNICEPAHICCDNLQAITNMYDPMYHSPTKHINIEYHWICKRIASHKHHSLYVKSKENLANLMTKALPYVQHSIFIQKLGMA